MTRRTVFIHVGAGKTATTAIQSAIPLLRKVLESFHVRAPLDPKVDPTLAEKPRPAAGYSFTLAKLLNPGYRRGKPFNILGAWKWLESELVNASIDDHNLLFSSEALQFAHPKELAKLSKLTTRLGWNVKIIFYARTAIDYTISEYLQHLKTGFIAFPSKDYPMTMGTYVQQAIAPFMHTLSVYSNVFGKSSLIVRNFDQERKEIIQSFFALVVGEQIPIPAITHSNRSLTRNEQEALERILILEGGPNMCRKIGAALAKAPLADNDSRLYYLTPEVINAYSENNIEVTRYVNKYLPPNQPIDISSDMTPLQINKSWKVEPDWHHTYTQFINLLQL
jgi:hypothetical protein